MECGGSTPLCLSRHANPRLLSAVLQQGISAEPVHCRKPLFRVRPLIAWQRRIVLFPPSQNLRRFLNIPAAAALPEISSGALGRQLFGQSHNDELIQRHALSLSQLPGFLQHRFLQPECKITSSHTDSLILEAPHEEK